MKKQAISLLIALTLLFAGFTAGFFLGRGYGASDVTLAVPAALLAPPPETTAPAQTEAGETMPTVSFPIDLNTAGEEELTALPGIGPVLARRILAYREENGPFRAVEELLNVSGVGEKRVEEIWDLVTIGG